MRVRGLKYHLDTKCRRLYNVAPRAGAWIEIFLRLTLLEIKEVAPRAGAWIEMLVLEENRPVPGRRTPCGCVD